MTSSTIKDEIRAATDIGQLMLEYTERERKTPDGFIVKCPVHREKTGSCYVHVRGDRAGTWKCFGCSAGGDCFDLVMAVNGWTDKQFGKAVEYLAERAGISTEPEPGEKPELKKTAADYAKIAEEREICSWWMRRRVDAVKRLLDAAVGKTDDDVFEGPTWAAAARIGAEYRRLGSLGPAESLEEFRMLATKEDRREWELEKKARKKLEQYLMAVFKCLGDADEALDLKVTYQARMEQMARRKA